MDEKYYRALMIYPLVVLGKRNLTGIDQLLSFGEKLRDARDKCLGEMKDLNKDSFSCRVSLAHSQTTYFEVDIVSLNSEENLRKALDIYSSIVGQPEFYRGGTDYNIIGEYLRGLGKKLKELSWRSRLTSYPTSGHIMKVEDI
jgi:hypothetical protein